MSFDRDSRPEPREPGVLSWEVPDGWQQGRGAFGGLSMVALARAAATMVDLNERPLRAMTAEIAGPVLVGHASIRTEKLREGSGLTLVSTRLEQGGEVAAHANVTFAKDRPSDLDRVEMEPPRTGDWRELPSASLFGMAPTFTQHVEYRIVAGIPFSGEKHARCEGWVRLLDAGPIDTHFALVGLVDAWFPSVMPVTTSPRPFGTVTFTAQVFDAKWSLAEPLYYRGRMLAGQHGFMAEQRELWSPTGELVALNHQTMVVIK